MRDGDAAHTHDALCYGLTGRVRIANIQRGAVGHGFYAEKWIYIVASEMRHYVEHEVGLVANAHKIDEGDDKCGFRAGRADKIDRGCNTPVRWIRE